MKIVLQVSLQGYLKLIIKNFHVTFLKKNWIAFTQNVQNIVKIAHAWRITQLLLTRLYPV